jgi:peptidylprolyl isomerase
MNLKHVVQILTLVLVSAIFISGCSGGGGIAAAKDGDTVRVHYTGTLDDGTEFDSSVGDDPLEFTVGGGQTISGFDQAVVGMKPGESKTVTIPPEEAYGPYRDELVQVVDRSDLPADPEPEVGQQWESRQPDGRVVKFIVIEVTESTVTLDANYRLAGETLTFEIELVEIL